MTLGTLGAYRYPRWWILRGPGDPGAAQKLADAARLLMVERATLATHFDPSHIDAVVTPCERLLEAWMRRLDSKFLRNITQAARAPHPDVLGNPTFRRARARVRAVAERVLDTRRVSADA